MPGVTGLNGALHRRGHVGQGGLQNTDLGPADGPAEVAEGTLILPKVATYDAETVYKVCMKTLFRDFQMPDNVAQQRYVWVEVSQGTGIPGELESTAEVS